MRVFGNIILGSQQGKSRALQEILAQQSTAAKVKALEQEALMKQLHEQNWYDIETGKLALGKEKNTITSERYKESAKQKAEQFGENMKFKQADMYRKKVTNFTTGMNEVYQKAISEGALQSQAAERADAWAQKNKKLYGINDADIPTYTGSTMSAYNPTVAEAYISNLIASQGRNVADIGYTNALTAGKIFDNSFDQAIAPLKIANLAIANEKALYDLTNAPKEFAAKMDKMYFDMDMALRELSEKIRMNNATLLEQQHAQALADAKHRYEIAKANNTMGLSTKDRVAIAADLLGTLYQTGMYTPEQINTLFPGMFTTVMDTAGANSSTGMPGVEQYMPNPNSPIIPQMQQLPVPTYPGTTPQSNRYAPSFDTSWLGIPAPGQPMPLGKIGTPYIGSAPSMGGNYTGSAETNSRLWKWGTSNGNN